MKNGHAFSKKEQYSWDPGTEKHPGTVFMRDYQVARWCDLRAQCGRIDEIVLLLSFATADPAPEQRPSVVELIPALAQIGKFQTSARCCQETNKTVKITEIRPLQGSTFFFSQNETLKKTCPRAGAGLGPPSDTFLVRSP